MLPVAHIHSLCDHLHSFLEEHTFLNSFLYRNPCSSPNLTSTTRRHQTLMTLSSWSTIPLEEVASSAPGGYRWFQLYVYKVRTCKYGADMAPNITTVAIGLRSRIVWYVLQLTREKRDKTISPPSLLLVTENVMENACEDRNTRRYNSDIKRIWLCRYLG